jgi:WD40 repeat protein
MPRRHALLIGINDYGCEMPRLLFAETDARELGEHLQTLCGFNVHTLLGAQATKPAFEKALTSGKLNDIPLEPEDVFLLYFAGHGTTVHGDRVYLHLHGASREHTARSYGASDLVLLLKSPREFAPQTSLIILDACRSFPPAPGQRGEAVVPSGPQLRRDIQACLSQRRDVVDRTVAVLFGCEPEQVSLEDPVELKHGLLAYHLIDALKHGQVLTLRDWVDETCHNCWNWSREQAHQRPKEIRPQRPCSDMTQYLRVPLRASTAHRQDNRSAIGASAGAAAVVPSSRYRCEQLWTCDYRCGDDTAFENLGYDVRITDEDITAVAFSPDTQFVLLGIKIYARDEDDAGDTTSVCLVLDANTGERLRRFDSYSDIMGIEVSPDNTHLIWDRDDDRKCLRAVRLDEAKDLEKASLINAEDLEELDDEAFWGSLVAFSPDGHVLCSGRNGFSLVDPTTAREMKRLTGVWTLLRRVVFRRDGRRLISFHGGKQTAAKLWDVEHGVELQTFAGDTGVVVAAAYSPDGRHIISASDDNTCKLWSVDEGRTLYTLPTGAQSVSFSLDGKQVLSCNAKEVRIWDITTRACISVFPAPVGLSFFELSSDGSRVLAHKEGKACSLWRIYRA